MLYVQFFFFFFVVNMIHLYYETILTENRYIYNDTFVTEQYLISVTEMKKSMYMKLEGVRRWRLGDIPWQIIDPYLYEFIHVYKRYNMRKTCDKGKPILSYHAWAWACSFVG